ADLTTRLDGVRTLDALEGVADALEVLQSLGIALEHLAASPGPRPGERVGSIDQRSQDGLCLDLLMMRGDGIHDLRRLAVFARDLAAYDRVGTLDLVGQGLADVVQQPGAPGLLDVQTQLACQQSRDVGGLEGMSEDVLRVREAILEHAN